jgi:aryl-alcohol dehydrogenase-like predicted oxidoreductase
LLTTCEELGITFVAYSPLGRGFLSGKIRRIEDLDETDYRRMAPRFTGENFRKNLAVVDKVEELAKAVGCTTPQLALAWVTGGSDNIVTIPGTTKLDRLEENAAAAQIELTTTEREAIDEVAPKGVAAGNRYDERGMRSVNG